MMMARSYSCCTAIVILVILCCLEVATESSPNKLIAKDDLFIIQAFNGTIFVLEYNTGHIIQIVQPIEEMFSDCFGSKFEEMDQRSDLHLLSNTANNIYLVESNSMKKFHIVHNHPLDSGPSYIKSVDKSLLTCRKDELIPISHDFYLAISNYLTILVDDKYSLKKSYIRCVKKFNLLPEDYSQFPNFLLAKSLKTLKMLNDKNQKLWQFTLKNSQIQEIFFYGHSGNGLFKLPINKHFFDHKLFQSSISSSSGAISNKITGTNMIESNYLLGLPSSHTGEPEYTLPIIFQAKSKNGSTLVQFLWSLFSLYSLLYAILLIFTDFLILYMLIKSSSFKFLVLKSARSLLGLELSYLDNFCLNRLESAKCDYFFKKDAHFTKLPLKLLACHKFLANNQNIVNVEYIEFPFCNQMIILRGFECNLEEFCSENTHLNARKNIFKQMLSAIKYAFKNGLNLHCSKYTIYFTDNHIQMIPMESNLFFTNSFKSTVKFIFESKSVNFVASSDPVNLVQFLQCLDDIEKISSENYTTNLRKLSNSPFMWTLNKSMHFLQSVSNVLESLNQNRNQHNAVSILFKIEGILEIDNWMSDWPEDLTVDVQQFRKYNQKSVRSLLRAIRNVSIHFWDSNHSSRFEKSLPRFAVFILDTYPTLLLKTWSILRDHFEQFDSLKKFYQPYEEFQ